MLKILIGGSPCTFWSIAQKNNREVTAEGLGWELFKNYLIAKEKFKPDYFLYENNKSTAQAIKAQIKKELKVWDGSSIIEDTGVRYIEINSALVSAQNRQRFYVHNCGEVIQPEDRGILLKDILESGESLSSNKKSYCLTASYNRACAWNTLERYQRDMVAETIRIPPYRNDDKSRPIIAGYAYKGAGVGSLQSECFPDNPNKQVSDYIAEPVRIGALPRPNGEPSTRQGAKTGLYAIPTDKPIYEVKDGEITIKGKKYPIKLPDGFYNIRKLTVTECARLQTMPDDYCRAVSDTQAYKGLGNGWTAEVIIHILNAALKNVPKDEEIIVLSMYDGIGTGRYCLDKMGFTNVKYFAYEIDKYAKQIAMSNYPDIIQMGDAFQLRYSGWTIGY